MAHVRAVQRKGGTAYEVRWRGDGATFKQRTFATDKEALDFSHEVRLTARDVGTANHLAGKSKTFREIAEASSAASAGRLKSKTASGYELGYRVHIFPTFGKRQINSITSLEVEKWLRGMETKTSGHTGRPLAPASVHACFIALSKVFAYALKHRLLPVNPCAVVDKPRLQHAEPVFLEPDQVAVVAGALDHEHPYGLIVRFAAYFFKPALRELGLPAVRWHDLRHFYASACAAAGIDIRKVSRWMGHASVNTTDGIYTHLFSGDHETDMDRLDALARRPFLVRSLASTTRG